MTDTSLSQGIVFAIQTYIDTYNHTIQDQMQKARTENDIVYTDAFSSMIYLVQALIVQNWGSLSAEDKEDILKQLSDRGSRLLYTPQYLEILLLLKSNDIAQLVEYVTYLTFMQYHVYKDHNISDWLYTYARDEVACSDEEVEYIQKRVAPLHGIVVNNSPSITDLDIPYIEKTLFELACKDFEQSGWYLLQRVRNLLVRIGKYHSHILHSIPSEAEMIYAMNPDPLVRVMYNAVIIDQKL